MGHKTSSFTASVNCMKKRVVCLFLLTEMMFVDLQMQLSDVPSALTQAG